MYLCCMLHDHRYGFTARTCLYCMSSPFHPLHCNVVSVNPHLSVLFLSFTVQSICRPRSLRSYCAHLGGRSTHSFDIYKLAGRNITYYNTITYYYAHDKDIHLRTKRKLGNGWMCVLLHTINIIVKMLVNRYIILISLRICLGHWTKKMQTIIILL